MCEQRVCVRVCTVSLSSSLYPEPPPKPCYCSLFYIPASSDSTAEEGYREMMFS